jgi:hypothetical protein
MNFKTLDLFFWAAGLLGHFILLVVLFLRGNAKTFPLFTGLIASNIAQTVALYTVHRFGTDSDYFRGYWTFAIFEVVLQLGVLYEIASIVFRPLGVWAPDVRRKLCLLVSVSFIIAGGLAWLASPPTERFAQSLFVKGSLFAAVLLSALFVVVTSVSTRVGLPWRSHVLQLAQGLGIYSIATFIVEAADTYFGLPTHADDYRIFRFVQHCRIAIYLCCLSYWIVSFYRKEVPRHSITSEMRNRLFHLQSAAAYHASRIQGADR